MTETCPAGSSPATGFAVVSRFTIANGTTGDVKRAFVERPHRVDSAAGFVRMDVLSPVDAPDEIWLLTYWTDEQSYRTWHRSHAYHESHAKIPRGIKLVPRATTIRLFEHVST